MEKNNNGDRGIVVLIVLIILLLATALVMFVIKPFDKKENQEINQNNNTENSISNNNGDNEQDKNKEWIKYVLSFDEVSAEYSKISDDSCKSKEYKLTKDELKQALDLNDNVSFEKNVVSGRGGVGPCDSNLVIKYGTNYLDITDYIFETDDNMLKSRLDKNVESTKIDSYCKDENDNNCYKMYDVNDKNYVNNLFKKIEDMKK